MIRLAGFVPHEDISIVFTGLRPGEKLFEELFDKEERVEPTSHPKLRKAVSNTFWSPEALETAIAAVACAVQSRDPDRVQEVLRRFVPSYQPMPGSVASNGVPSSQSVVAEGDQVVDTEFFSPLVVSTGSVAEPSRPSPAS